MGGVRSALDRIRKYEANIIEDILVASLWFFTISVAWSYAPASWPRLLYYVLLGVGLFGYFKYVSPPPSNGSSDS